MLPETSCVRTVSTMRDRRRLDVGCYCGGIRVATIGAYGQTIEQCQRCGVVAWPLRKQYQELFHGELKHEDLIKAFKSSRRIDSIQQPCANAECPVVMTQSAFGHQRLFCSDACYHAVRFGGAPRREMPTKRTQRKPDKTSGVCRICKRSFPYNLSQVGGKPQCCSPACKQEMRRVSDRLRHNRNRIKASRARQATEQQEARKRFRAGGLQPLVIHGRDTAFVAPKYQRAD